MDEQVEVTCTSGAMTILCTHCATWVVMDTYYAHLIAEHGEDED